MQNRNRKKVIEIFVVPTGWIARFVDDEKIMDAFGTDSLPLPFTAVATVEEVEQQVQKLNPHHEIRRA